MVHDLQLPMIPTTIITQIGHRHDLNHQTRPTREMLRALSRACLGIVLLPRKPRAFPFVEDDIDEVFAEGVVDLGGLGFVGARLVGDVLVTVSRVL